MKLPPRKRGCHGQKTSHGIGPFARHPHISSKTPIGFPVNFPYHPIPPQDPCLHSKFSVGWTMLNRYTSIFTASPWKILQFLPQKRVISRFDEDLNESQWNSQMTSQPSLLEWWKGMKRWEYGFTMIHVWVWKPGFSIFWGLTVS